MSKQNEAIKFIDIYNQSSDSLEFTKAVYVLKTSNPALYDAVINEIKKIQKASTLSRTFNSYFRLTKKLKAHNLEPLKIKI